MNDNNPNEKNENMRNSSIPNSGNNLLKNLHANLQENHQFHDKQQPYPDFLISMSLQRIV